jgi:hypothetical protein
MRSLLMWTCYSIMDSARHFITADYTFGRALATNAKRFVTEAAGKILGEAANPFPWHLGFRRPAAERVEQRRQCDRLRQFRRRSRELPEAGQGVQPSANRRAACRHNDNRSGSGLARIDGRKLHPACLFRIKTPQLTRGIGDVYTLAATIPADQAFRSLANGGCNFVKS